MPHDVFEEDLSGGNVSPGAPVVRKFAFAFDTPDIATGHAIYTPTVGEVLLDAWFVQETLWNVDHAFADVGQFAGPFATTNGWFGSCLPAPADLASAADSDWANGLLAGNTDMHLADANLFSSLWNGVMLSSTAGTAMSPQRPTNRSPLSFGNRVVPAAFLTADPVKVVVSLNGNPTGGDVGATAGAASLYLITATPV